MVPVSRSALALAACAAVLVLANGAGARPAGNANFVGAWAVSTGVSFTITSETAGGACTGTAPGFTITNCQVTGNHYAFLVVQPGSAYKSQNNGTLKGNTLSGVFRDTNGAVIKYTAKRAAPAKLGIDWSMPKRLTSATPAAQNWDVLDGLPPTSEIYPKDWQVDLFLTSGGMPTCPAGVTYVWTVTGGGTTQTLPGTGCRVTATVPRLGTYSVKAKEFKSGSPTGVKASNTKVEVQDFLIVGLGDSNGSGEGNAPFYYKRCNRSVASYQFQAALYVEDQDPHSSVTFIHASCSGARIDHLYTTPYAGTRPANPPLDPQLDQVSLLLDHQKPARKVDAVILSVGVNDLAFGGILEFCIVHAAAPASAPCEGLPAIEQLDSVNRTIGFSAANSSTTPTLGDRLTTLQHQLLARYGPLATAMSRPVAPKGGGLGVAPKDVFITQYPDFTNGDNGTPCGPTGLARFGTSTWAWLGLNAELLNRTVAAAAAKHHWTLAPVNSAAFANRGYCASKPLFVGIAGASLGHFDVAGPFHPDGEAHLIQAAEVEPKLCASLGLSDTCE